MVKTTIQEDFVYRLEGARTNFWQKKDIYERNQKRIEELQGELEDCRSKSTEHKDRMDAAESSLNRFYQSLTDARYIKIQSVPEVIA